jgi:predicted GTPase
MKVFVWGWPEQMNLVDTPGTNVILQRQQRLTEEFVPRADLVLFVLSADRPLTDSEVCLQFFLSVHIGIVSCCSTTMVRIESKSS